jgi:hypothetical protein
MVVELLGIHPKVLSKLCSTFVSRDVVLISIYTMRQCQYYRLVIACRGTNERKKKLKMSSSKTRKLILATRTILSNNQESHILKSWLASLWLSRWPSAAAMVHRRFLLFGKTHSNLDLSSYIDLLVNGLHSIVTHAPRRIEQCYNGRNIYRL